MKTTRTDARKRPATASKIDKAELSAKRRAVSAMGLAARWGAARTKSVQIRVDKSAADALLAVPEIDRRRVASEGVRQAVDEYTAQKTKFSPLTLCNGEC